jgi:hypothetical protein
MYRRRSGLSLWLCPYIYKLKWKLLDTIDVHIELTISVLEHTPQASVLTAQTIHLLLQVLHLFD